jgi:methyltransferase (TIGR00027 family)
MNALKDPLPSTTALMSAAARAAHDALDNPPRLIHDLDAKALCALFEPSPLDFQLAFPEEPVLAAARASTVIRAAFAHQALTDSGLDQCIVLGAGLDTSVYRGATTSVWLVDRAEVLAWRRTLFGQAGLADPAVAVAADLVAADLLPRLVEAGLERERPVLAVGLGLSMYLDPQQNRDILAQLAGLAEGSQLVFDAILPDDESDEAGRRYTGAVAAAAGASGEPWLSRIGREPVAGILADYGWRLLTQVAEAEAAPRLFWDANPHLRPMRLVQLIHACRG